MTAALAGAEQALLRRVAWRITVQTAALFMVCLLLLAGVAGVLIVHTQTSDAQGLLRQAIADTDAVTDPPSGILIYETNSSGAHSSTELHGVPLEPQAVDAVAAGASTSTGSGHADGRDYLIRTGRRDGTTVQAALDLTSQHAERRRLVDSLALVGAIGLVLALLVGRIIALRAIRPLGAAIGRQQRFIADASHELRTPLTQVHTRAQLIARAIRDSDSPELVADTQRLVRSTRQLGDIVDELLVSAQLRAQPQHMERVDIADLATDVVDAEQARAVEQGIDLTVSADAGAHWVPGSPTALRRVLGSLVDNALGHTVTGGHVHLDVASDGHHVVCAVRDDGVGFDTATADHLFERFARGIHGTGRRYGLGLALVREVVQAHQGTITANGTVGHGAIFTMTLPAWAD